MNLFEKLFRALNDRDVQYVIVGGVAVNLYGIERATGDVDLMVNLETQNLTRFIETANELNLVPRIPVELDKLLDPSARQTWHREKGMVAFSLYDSENSWFQVDVLIHEPIPFSEAHEKREQMNFGDTIVSVAPIDVLISMKENTGRPQDEADVVYLKKVIAELGSE
jgi:hypothetical protein